MPPDTSTQQDMAVVPRELQESLLEIARCERAIRDFDKYDAQFDLAATNAKEPKV